MMGADSQRIKFLDVGHGDCSVIYMQDDKGNLRTIVIDIPQSDKLLCELQENNVCDKVSTGFSALHFALHFLFLWSTIRTV